MGTCCAEEAAPHDGQRTVGARRREGRRSSAYTPTVTVGSSAHTPPLCYPCTTLYRTYPLSCTRWEAGQREAALLHVNTLLQRTRGELILKRPKQPY